MNRELTQLEPAAPARPADGFDQAILQWLAGTTNQGVIITDRQLRVRLWNAWLEAHSGFTVDEVVGRELQSLFPELVRRGIDSYYRSVLQGNVHVLSQRLHRYLIPLAPTADGDLGVMRQHASIAPLTAGDAVVGTVTIIQDVSERVLYEQTVRERERFTDAVLNSLPEAVAVIGYGGAILAVNAAWEQLCVAQRELRALTHDPGHNYLEFCRQAAAAGDATARRALDGITAVMERLLTAFTMEYVCQGREERWYRMDVVPLAGDTERVVVMHRPISRPRCSCSEIPLDGR
ncbi:MAG: hypothetical protein OHK0015_55110 [Chloroflexi bacterium OHK40]